MEIHAGGVVRSVSAALAWLRGVRDALWEMSESEVLRIANLDRDDCTRMRHLMRKYRDLPMDLADAALVALAERERIHRISTIDRRDFSVYKPAGMRRFEIIP